MKDPSSYPTAPASVVVALAFLGLFQGPSSACVTCKWENQQFYCISEDTGWNRCQASSTTCTLSGGTCGDSGCFLAGTDILTPRGHVPIEELKSGDRVVARSTAGARRTARVLTTRRGLSDGYFIINGALRVTATHPFYVGGQWRTAEELQLGDALTTSTGHRILVRSKEWVNRGVRVYNIDVDGPDTVFAGGFLVHNKDPKPKDPNGR